jgi:hypothetical protein
MFFIGDIERGVDACTTRIELTGVGFPQALQYGLLWVFATQIS